IHHRVKNNLQVISSLLNLQAGNLGDPRALEMLKESQNRVRSMAMVHEQLHRSRNLSKINFGEYVRNLAASLFCSYGVESNRISLRLEIDDIAFGIDTAIPCGLIIQELVSNSLKHAFPDNRSGEIRIALSAGAGGGKVLSVEDDGVGLPANIKCDYTRSLGLRLVRILAEQVDATFAYSKRNGTQFQIEIPETL
ncbi:MAG: sensor histidine kinase, partial [bacterium]|nr:sensor histidine kinase [bacterium]